MAPVAALFGGLSLAESSFATLFAREGASVVITGRDAAALDAAARGIGGAAAPFRGDVAELADLDALAGFVAERHGRVDVVFANAGGGRPGLFEQVSEDDFDFTVGTNLRGTYFTVQKLVPLMTTGGSIILNTSILASQGRAGFSVYAATKAAIRSLARSLTAELSAKQIRVNALAPGQIDTDLMRKVGMPDEMIEQVRAQAAAQIPMARTGSADEVAKAALFLASDDGNCVASEREFLAREKGS